jgi:hypothetical protein
MANARKCFVLCIKNKGFEVSLEPRKLYQVLPDRDAARHQQLRVIDESGEDYLIPRTTSAKSIFLTPFEGLFWPPSDYALERTVDDKVPEAKRHQPADQRDR